MRKLVGLACLLWASAVVAAPADAVKTRIDGLRELGAAFKAIRDGLAGDEPQTILIQQSARQVRNAASQMSGWFPAGSGAESGAKTSAKAEIWTQPARFKADMDSFVAAAARFQKVAAGGDGAAMRAAMADLGGTCKGCHDSFRVPRTS
ncbi:MAG: cytochrome c [Sphingomonadales bacterium]|nr:cytochrome c [Sphingomonadales bacterium]